MNLWERCKNYGLTHIQNNGDVRLYYNQFEYTLASTPLWLHVKEAFWQGGNLLVRGTGPSDRPMVYIMDGFNSYREI